MDAKLALEVKSSVPTESKNCILVKRFKYAQVSAERHRKAYRRQASSISCPAAYQQTLLVVVPVPMVYLQIPNALRFVQFTVLYTKHLRTNKCPSQAQMDEKCPRGARTDPKTFC